MAYHLRRHAAIECPDLGELESLSATEGHVFVERTRDEWLAGVNRFDRPGECFFLAKAAGRTVGMCGVNSDPFVDDPAVGRLRHLYVHPRHRRIGMAEALVNRCLAISSGHFRRIRLRTTNPAADQLYRSLGFQGVGDSSSTLR